MWPGSCGGRPGNACEDEGGGAGAGEVARVAATGVAVIEVVARASPRPAVAEAAGRAAAWAAVLVRRRGSCCGGLGGSIAKVRPDEGESDGGGGKNDEGGSSRDCDEVGDATGSGGGGSGEGGAA